MEITDIIGYLAALLVGIVMGLLGGGGSILTVPIFVYLFKINPIFATAYSLFVVGVSALFGAFQNFKKGLVDLRTAIIFSIPAFIAVYATRKYLIPIIPETVLEVAGVVVTRDMAIMVFFAILMVLAAFSMILDKNGLEIQTVGPKKYNYPLIVFEGLGVGLATGIVGAGGGFLIIPALVLLAKLPMKEAIGTSLLIIAIKSLIGFIGDVQNLELNWNFLLIFTGISIVGIILGVWATRFVSGKQLQKAFGWLVLLMGIFIIYSELS